MAGVENERLEPRGIAVLDVGSTNTKLFLFDPDLTLHAEETIVSVHTPGPPYLHIDPEPVLAFAARILTDFDGILPVDAVVPSAHGSGLALLDADGELVLPVMDYEAEPPAEIAESYARIEPPFDQVFAPTNPGALTLGRQLHWQETLYPEAFATTRTIVPWGQYVAHRLGGRLVTEITALGAQTHLLAVKTNAYSSLAIERGWARQFAPLEKAWAPIGTLADGFRGASFRGHGAVLTGIHDSNANFLRYLASDLERFTLLSSGTWIIGFDTEADIATLDPRLDVVSNTTVFGDPVASCRFMGGREFAIVAGDAPADTASEAALNRLVSQRTFALPSFTDSGGPMPGTGGMGRIVGPAPETPEERARLAALYCALMTACSLRAVGAKADVIVDGPFSENRVYLTALAAAVPDNPVFASRVRNGTSTGAALLALADGDGRIPTTPVTLEPVAPVECPDFSAYQDEWLALSQR